MFSRVICQWRMSRWRHGAFDFLKLFGTKEVMMNQTNFFAGYIHAQGIENPCLEKLTTTVPSAQAQVDASVKRQCAVLICDGMQDALVDITQQLGISSRDAHYVYTSGGWATRDAIHALIDSNKSHGTQEWFVIHHTACDKLFLSEAPLGNTNDNHNRDFSCNCHMKSNGIEKQGDSVGMHPTITNKHLLARHARRIRHHPLVPREIPVHGCLYDGSNGNLWHVSTNLRQPLHLPLD
jgi:carbonic anhydrase